MASQKPGFLVVAVLVLVACSNEQQSSTENYHPQPSVIFNSNPGTLQYNPKHGEPGHRCDLPDGAPLPSPSVSSADAAAELAKYSSAAPASQTVNPTMPDTSFEAASAATTSPKLNPEHGKPGHRCDIAVGAPLNSPAGTTIATTKPATPLPATPTINQESSQIPLETDSSGNLVRLNPAHGQPGHDCSIPVGKPLKQ